jgi:uncharacterized protein DUF1638
MSGARRHSALLGCGILAKEIRHLIDKNGWPLEPVFLPSGLHVDFDRLAKGLTGLIARHDRQDRLIFYGACHPLMEDILAESRCVRTPGQNCVEIYLGSARFRTELAAGAFFLFEDWARHWNQIVGGIFPGDPEIMRSIFACAHKYLLAIRTPCAGDFTAEAEAISRMISLELRWLDAGLEHLEQNLAETMLSSGTSPK